jgi:hypothetical protein
MEYCPQQRCAAQSSVSEVPLVNAAEGHRRPISMRGMNAMHWAKVIILVIINHRPDVVCIVWD